MPIKMHDQRVIIGLFLLVFSLHTPTSLAQEYQPPALFGAPIAVEKQNQPVNKTVIKAIRKEPAKKPSAPIALIKTPPHPHEKPLFKRKTKSISTAQPDNNKEPIDLFVEKNFSGVVTGRKTMPAIEAEQVLSENLTQTAIPSICVKSPLSDYIWTY